MNTTSLVVYDVCRFYLMDRRSTLQECHFQQILGYLRSRDVPRLAKVCDSLTPLYNMSESIRTLRQVSAFFKKHRDLADDDKCRTVALQAFEACETRCRITNRRLDYYFFAQPRRLDADLRIKVIKMQAWIESVLGPFDDFLEALPRLIRVTSGATSTRSRRKSLPHFKVSKRLVCTPAAEPYLQALSSYLGYGKLKVKHTLWNRVEAVRKNWLTHRLIACEPEGNLPLQLAFDAYGKERLARKGQDLRDQFRNQRLAYEASISSDSLATVDFSSASDLISFNTVALLISDQRWWDYLTSIRSPMYRIDTKEGRAHIYSKYSSMGNGATFVLETLIFAAACHAVGSKRYSVYGDDVIIESELLPAFRELTRFLGFRINEDKTFSAGPFRESCGKDYFNGTDVTPFYLRYEDNRKPTICHIVNSCAPLATHGHLWLYLKSLIALHKLPFCPVNLNTMSGIWIDNHSAYKAGLIRTKDWISYFRAYTSKRKLVKEWDIRALFLWYLTSTRRTTVSLDEQIINKDTKFALLSGSYVPTSTERYSRKWVVWFPTHGGPQHAYLYAWSDFISAN